MTNTKQQSIVDLTWQNWDPTNKKTILARSRKESQLIASEAVEQNAKVLRLIC